MKQARKVEMSKSQEDDFVKRIKNSGLDSSDQDIITGLIEFNKWLQFSVEEKSISVKKLQKIFGSKSEKRKKRPKSAKENNDPQSPNLDSETQEASDNSSCETESPAKEAEVEESTPETNNKLTSTPKNASKHSGRLSYQSYTGADIVPLSLPFKIGDPCPEDCGGKLKDLPPGNVIKITGQSFAKATNYVTKRLRCNLCEKYFTAQLPEQISPEKYDSSFKAYLCVHKHFLGTPNYRIASYQEFIGIPIPDSTQWDKIEEVANDVYPAFKQLEIYAANAHLTHGDDTGVKILSVIKENKEAEETDEDTKKTKKRKGTYTTGVVAFNGKHQINLFYSGRKHAGENVKALFQKRSSNLPKAMHMCDAINSNLPKELKAIVLGCLVHGRRNFVDIEHCFPDECEFILDIFSIIYKHEEEIKSLQLSNERRLEYHRQHSRPHVKKLYKWINEQFRNNLIEPNSSLGKACNYMLNHAKKLTRFLRISGAPLDNNICERALKMAIRVRRNSLFYATEHGAYVGGLLQSLIYTCIANKQNPVDYLTKLQEHKHDVRQNPKSWMPWNYCENLDKAQLLAA